MDVIQMARELGKAIQQQEAFKNFQEAQNKADNDQPLQDMIGEFNLKRMDLNSAINEESKDQEKLDRLDQELRDMYDTVMNNPTMIAISETKQEMDRMMNFINQILVASINGKDPDLVEETTSSCGGSCSSCSGCQ